MRHAAPSRGPWSLTPSTSRGRHRAPSTLPGAGRLGTTATVLLVAGGTVAGTSAAHFPRTTTTATGALPATAAAATGASGPRADTTGTGTGTGTSTSGTGSAAPARDVLPRADRSRYVVGPLPSPSPPPPPTPVLPGCDAAAVARAAQVEAGGYANGRLPDDVLCPAVGSPDERLRADAALALVPLAAAYRERFGEAICTTDGYRPLAEQQVLRHTRRRYAAPVGTSNHGWGTAIDVSCGVNSFRTERHAWMRANAPRFGWVLPEWAQPGGSRPEPWHWEYVGH